MRVALGAVEHSMSPLIAAGFAFRSREPQNLDGLEQLVLEHLADVEDLLAHIGRMKISEDRPLHLRNVA